MLPANSRLKKADFDLLKKGVFVKKNIQGGNFSLKIFYTEFKPSRFSVILSSSEIKKANVRNKIKRRIKAVIVKHLLSFDDKLAVIVYPKKEVFKLSFNKLELELMNLFKKANIL